MTAITLISPAPIILNRKEGKNNYCKKSTDKNKAMTVKLLRSVPWRRPPNKTGYAESRRAEKYQNIGHSSFSKIAESRACQKDSKKNFSKQPPLS